MEKTIWKDRGSFYYSFNGKRDDKGQLLIFNDKGNSIGYFPKGIKANDWSVFKTIQMELEIGKHYNILTASGWERAKFEDDPNHGKCMTQDTKLGKMIFFHDQILDIKIDD